ncbi:MAG TPA: hypothetical protein ENK02_01900 [Planctomycetes bacterium]|nr:hypothetical protein [Planctomycetota bacterium]
MAGLPGEGLWEFEAAAGEVLEDFHVLAVAAQPAEAVLEEAPVFPAGEAGNPKTRVSRDEEAALACFEGNGDGDLGPPPACPDQGPRLGVPGDDVARDPGEGHLPDPLQDGVGSGERLGLDGEEKEGKKGDEHGQRIEPGP